MLCLCPNHHSQFDQYSFYVDPDSLEIIGLDEIRNKELDVVKGHRLDRQFLSHHYEEFIKKNLRVGILKVILKVVPEVITNSINILLFLFLYFL